MKSYRSNSFAQNLARTASGSSSRRGMPSRSVWELPASAPGSASKGRKPDRKPASLRDAIEAALTAVSAGQPVPQESIAALLLEARKALTTGRLGVVRDRLGGAATSSPKQRAGEAALKGARADALARAEADAEAANAELKDGERPHKVAKPGKLDNSYYQGFADLWEAVRSEASFSERTVLALAIAGHDQLWTLSGGVSDDDIVDFGMTRAADFAGDVARAAPRLGGDGLWYCYIEGIQACDLVSGHLYKSTPAHIRPNLVDRLLRDDPSRKRLTANIDLLELMIGDMSSTDMDYSVLAARVATRDVGKLSADGRLRWAQSITLTGLQSFSPTAQANLLAVLTPAMMTKGITDWLDERVKDASMSELVDLFDRRFDIQVGPRNGMNFDETVLRQLWPVLGQLPASAVANNPSVHQLLPLDNQSSYSEGGHSPTSNDIYLGWSQTSFATQTLEDVPNINAHDSLEDINALNHALRHEIGHAVDDSRNIMQSNRGSATLGGWESFSSDAELAAAMVRDDLKKVKSPELAKALSSGEQAQVRELGGNEMDNVANTLDPASRSWSGEPTTTVGDHVYRKGSEGWQRYDADARDRKVSNYQFKSPGEWFAEAYAAYFALDTPGAGLSMDSAAATWIQNNAVGD